MNKKIIISGKKLTIWILNFSILGLILTSLFPIISIPESDAVKEELYFNYEMMENSEDVEIKSLVDDINLINILFWAVIIIGLISFFCITYLTFLTRWYLSILAIISAVILIFSILLVLLQYSFLKAVSNIDYIVLSSAFYVIKYWHIILFFGILMLICSIFYTLNIVLDLGRKLFDSRSKKPKIKKKKKQPDDLPIKPIIDKKTTITPESIDKKVKMEKWLNREVQNIDNKPEEDVYNPQEKIMKPIEATQEEQIYVNDKIETSEKKTHPGPFATDKRKEKPEDSEEPKVAASFEEALSSAIEKKQSELEHEEHIETKTEETPKESDDTTKQEVTQNEQIEEVKEKADEHLSEKDVITTEIIVKCPQCKHIFATKKEEDSTKIKCPQCGKEGIAQ
jgi:ribosomal protein S27E